MGYDISFNTQANEFASHAEGPFSVASGSISHAEGNGTTASSDSSHAEGSGTRASGFAAISKDQVQLLVGIYLILKD
ncbi:hypothetical protein SB775_17710 [Peribacillus sp. SIMBA_075]|uniref:hypothetical protein n=1 Tax=Peribacillus sp. SIMBA_075 TaxID=3085813 RepID=UPI00397CD0E5